MALKFKYSSRGFLTNVRRAREAVAPVVSPSSTFDTVLRTGWNDRMRDGLFRYHLDGLQTRVLPGPRCYVAQLNIQRGVKRRKPEEIVSIDQPYNPKQFNFNKINPEEILFEMTKHTVENEHPLVEAQTVVVLINVSPLEFGHCLFVPEPWSCLPQVLTPLAVRTGIEAVFLSSDPCFRVGFNSLGALASVNHLHLHGYYLEHELLIESMPVEPLVPERGFYRMATFPKGFLFYTESEDVEKVTGAVFQVTDFFVSCNIAHNLFLTRGCPPSHCPNEKEKASRRGVRIAVWPRMSSFGAKEEVAFNVALCELAGHLPFKLKHEYDRMTEKEVDDIVQRYLLPDKEFLRLEEQLTTIMAHADF